MTVRVWYMLITLSLGFGSDRALFGATGQVTVSARNGLIFEMKINGEGPYSTLFDTGGVNQISAARAKKLGLRIEATPVQFGAIGGSLSAHTTHIDRLTIGDLILRDQTFYVLDIPPGVGAPELVVGWEIMNHFAIRIDVDHSQLTFFDGRSFRYSGTGMAVPLITHRDATGAEIRAEIDGAPGVFLFDTGNQKGLFLNSKFVQNHNLVAALNAHFRVYNGRGLGGLAPEALLARLHVLSISNIEIPDPLVRLQTAPDGPWANDGNIGESILSRFNLTIDCIRHVVYFEKRSNWNQHEIFNRAGLILDVDSGQEVVMTVLPNSPSAVAGVMPGDHIILINGQAPAVDPHDPAFYKPVGTMLHLRIDRGGALKVISVTLSDLL